MSSTYLLSFISAERAQFIWKLLFNKKNIFSLDANIFTYTSSTHYILWRTIYSHVVEIQFFMHKIFVDSPLVHNFPPNFFSENHKQLHWAHRNMFVKGCLVSTLIPFLSTTSQLWKCRPIRMSFLLKFNVIFKMFDIHFGKANISWRIFE